MLKVHKERRIETNVALLSSFICRGFSGACDGCKKYAQLHLHASLRPELHCIASGFAHFIYMFSSYTPPPTCLHMFHKYTILCLNIFHWHFPACFPFQCYSCKLGCKDKVFCCCRCHVCIFNFSHVLNVCVCSGWRLERVEQVVGMRRRLLDVEEQGVLPALARHRGQRLPGARPPVYKLHQRAVSTEWVQKPPTHHKTVGLTAQRWKRWCSGCIFSHWHQEQVISGARILE